MSTRDSLGDRMKQFERASRAVLPRRLPLILRVDGKAFHTYTRKCARPFDSQLANGMLMVAAQLCEEIQGAQIAFAQSDEISVLIHNYKRFESKAWFDNQVQKLTSVSAGIASAVMTAHSPAIFGHVKPAVFDARVFVLPEAEVCNYFIWRQQDATRNSIQMLAQSLYSHKELHEKTQPLLQEMCFAKGHNWNDLETRWKRGTCVLRRTYEVEGTTRSRWVPDLEIPIFTQDRAYINRHLDVEEE